MSFKFADFAPGRGTWESGRKYARAMPDLPSAAEVDDTIKVITDHAPRIFLWNYERERDQLVTLYNKGMSSQWNSVTDLDWDTVVDPEKLVSTGNAPSMFVTIARAAAQVSGSPFAKWSEKEFTQLGIETLQVAALASSCTASRGR